MLYRFQNYKMMILHTQIDVEMGGDHFCRYVGVNLVQLLLIFHPS